MQEEVTNFPIKKVWVVALIVLIVMMVNRPFTTIDSSERGIVYRFDAVQDNVLTEWFHMLTPFVDSVKTVPIVPTSMEVNIPVDSQGAITKDNQTIGVDMTMFYRFPEPDLVNIAKNYGFDMIKTKITRDLNEAFKQVIGTYTIFDVASKQEEIRALVISGLVTKIGEYPVIIDDVKITNYDWSQSFDDQIAMTMQIAQEAKQQEQQLNKIEIEAQQQVVKAQANFDAEKLNAEAQKVKWEGIRDYNAAITANPKNMELELKLKQLEIEKLRVEKWNGVYVSTNNYGPIPVSTSTLQWQQ